MPSALPPIQPPEITAQRPWRILIVGAAYGGLTALMHFIDLSNAKQRPDHRADVPKFEGAVPARGVDVTVLDERDGFCMFSISQSFLPRCEHVATSPQSKADKNKQLANSIRYKSTPSAHL